MIFISFAGIRRAVKGFTHWGCQFWYERYSFRGFAAMLPISLSGDFSGARRREHTCTIGFWTWLGMLVVVQVCHFLSDKMPELSKSPSQHILKMILRDLKPLVRTHMHYQVMNMVRVGREQL